MINIILTGSKYLIIIFFAVFTYVSFRAQADTPEENKKSTFIFQKVLVLFVHFLCFLCIFLNVYKQRVDIMNTGQVFLIYALTAAYLIFMLFALPSLINLSKGLNNVMCMLIAIGFVFQTRLDWNSGIRNFIYMAAATIIFIFFQVAHRRIKGIRNLTWVYCILGLVLLIAVYVFAAVSRGAKTSIDLGFISIQPFEFVKILFVLFVAAAFNKSNDFKQVLITAVTGAVYIIIMVLCSELGTALILAVVYVLMLYVATKKVRYIFIGAGAFAAACIAAYILFSHVRVRVDVWLNPWADIDNKGYQITQSLFAIGTGGWLGSGIFGGQPKNVPMVSNDFIFSAIAEELGTIFVIFLILLSLCLVLMIFRIAIRISNPFYKLLSFGLGATYGFQVFLTIGGAIKFIPSTGINLPFLSSGGSSILASMIILGIIQALYVISESDVAAERELFSERLAGGEEIEDESYDIIPDGEEDIDYEQVSWRVSKVDSKDINIF